MMRKIHAPLPPDHPRFAFDLKGWLIFLNLRLDVLLLDIRCPKRPSSLTHRGELFELSKLTLALEDRYYFEHSGIDIRALARIIKQITKRTRVGGVSTIEQQYVRTHLQRRDRTFSRKLNEVVLAWLLSHRSEKIDVLHAYLSCAYFGYKLNGCDSAAKFVFGKPAIELTEREAALIASLLVYPVPKTIFTSATTKAMLPTSDIEAFLCWAVGLTPWWAGRVKKRMEYGLIIARKAEQSTH